MKAIIKEGKELLFLEGASGKNLEDIKDEMIINLKERWTFQSNRFKKGTLTIQTTEGLIVITFSAPVIGVVLGHYEKDQLVYKIIKQDG